MHRGPARSASAFPIASGICGNLGKRLPDYFELTELGGSEASSAQRANGPQTSTKTQATAWIPPSSSKSSSSYLTRRESPSVRPTPLLSSPSAASPSPRTDSRCPTEQPVFYYDLGSPYAWLAAERIHQRAAGRRRSGSRSCSGASGSRPAGGPGASPTSATQGMREIEERARRVRPAARQVARADWPTNTLKAMRAAIFAQQTGRTVAFSLAAFRQAFAAGRDLSDVDNVLIAAAACELHPERRAQGHRAAVHQGPPQGRHRRRRTSAGSGACRASWSATRSSGATIASRTPRKALDAGVTARAAADAAPPSRGFRDLHREVAPGTLPAQWRRGQKSQGRQGPRGTATAPRRPR